MTVHWEMAQRSCGVSLTRDHRICLDTVLCRVLWSDPAWSGRLAQVTRCPLHPDPFCELVLEHSVFSLVCFFTSALKIEGKFLWVIRIEDKGHQNAMHTTAINLTLPSPHHAMWAPSVFWKRGNFFMTWLKWLLHSASIVKCAEIQLF